jgi:hypothetical protein
MKVVVTQREERVPGGYLQTTLDSPKEACEYVACLYNELPYSKVKILGEDSDGFVKLLFDSDEELTLCDSWMDALYHVRSRTSSRIEVQTLDED